MSPIQTEADRSVRTPFKDFNPQSTMKLNTLILLAFAAALALFHVSCAPLTPAQKQAIAVKVSQDVLDDVAAGVPVLLTTGNAGAAGVAMAAQGAKNLPGLTTTVSQVLEARPVSAKNPVVVIPPAP